ncbi:RodZ domain-containing protein [Streptomyces sp. NPDC091289]|uniref:RodZ domain-containing protein n=1 Tax=Streptomyces sp. NPDC091289 TaxID=3365989 RepID=UPI00381D66AA
MQQREPGAGIPGSIGVYTVERELGAGGMGTVYLARSRGGRPVAVKVARPELAADPQFRERFRAEIDAARRVGGFHTASVVDADPDASAPWLATAYISGPTLAELLAAHGPMDESRLRLLGAALAEALQAIHACGLVHRDLKPGNIIMASDGPRVLDFGIARAVESTRLTSTGAAFGTPGFLAPEQAEGLEVDGSADVFALGAVLIAAAGGSAFGVGTPMGMMYRSVHKPADLSAVPPGLHAVIAACLSKEPARRPTPAALTELFVPGPAPHTPTVISTAQQAPAGPGSDRTMPDGSDGSDGGGTVEPAPGLAGGGVPHHEAVTIDAAGRGTPAAHAESGTGRPAPAGRSRGRVLAAVLVATVAIAALAGGALLLLPDDDRDDDPSTAAPGPSYASSAAVPSSASPPPMPTTPDAAVSRPAGKVTVMVGVEGQTSWVDAKGSDGRRIFDGSVPAGTTKTFTDEERIDLVLSNGSAIRLVVNGRRIEDSFQPGEVVRLTYTKDD